MPSPSSDKSPRLPHPHPSTDWPAFKITVYVPAGGGKSLGALETRLGQFEHVFPDLSNTRFTKLKVAAANVPMAFDVRNHSRATLASYIYRRVVVGCCRFCSGR